ncbi:MAG TPA: sucrase ferredoxin [Gaiellaceae bacterium]|nr:sucrase ferredoxin [Gaiellaceae bacterium]
MRLPRAFCSEVSAENAEPLAATASRVDHWILVEYKGLWGHDALAGSGLSDQVKRHLREQASARRSTKLLFVRRTERRGRPGVAVRWGDSPESGGTFYRAELDGYEDLLDLDLTAPGAPLGHPLLLVCTHGKHDRCCARYGRPLYQALAEQAEEDWVWQSSHLGGDRFAGNMVFLPEGLYFGRVGPGEVWPLLDEYLANRILLDNYRGRACYAFRVQAAERAVREATGLRGIGDLELVQREGDLVAFRAGGRLYDVQVTPEEGALTHLTCSSETLRHPRHYAARILHESGA